MKIRVFHFFLLAFRGLFLENRRTSSLNECFTFNIYISSYLWVVGVFHRNMYLRLVRLQSSMMGCFQKWWVESYPQLNWNYVVLYRMLLTLIEQWLTEWTNEWVNKRNKRQTNKMNQKFIDNSEKGEGAARKVIEKIYIFVFRESAREKKGERGKGHGFTIFCDDVQRCALLGFRFTTRSKVISKNYLVIHIYVYLKSSLERKGGECLF